MFDSLTKHVAVFFATFESIGIDVCCVPSVVHLNTFIIFVWDAFCLSLYPHLNIQRFSFPLTKIDIFQYLLFSFYIRQRLWIDVINVTFSV